MQSPPDPSKFTCKNFLRETSLIGKGSLFAMEDKIKSPTSAVVSWLSILKRKTVGISSKKLILQGEIEEKGNTSIIPPRTENSPGIVTKSTNT